MERFGYVDLKICVNLSKFDDEKYSTVLCEYENLSSVKDLKLNYLYKIAKDLNDVVVKYNKNQELAYELWADFTPEKSDLKGVEDSDDNLHGNKLSPSRQPCCEHGCNETEELWTGF